MIRMISVMIFLILLSCNRKPQYQNEITIIMKLDTENSSEKSQVIKIIQKRLINDSISFKKISDTSYEMMILTNENTVDPYVNVISEYVNIPGKLNVYILAYPDSVAHIFDIIKKSIIIDEYMFNNLFVSYGEHIAVDESNRNYVDSLFKHPSIKAILEKCHIKHFWNWKLNPNKTRTIYFSEDISILTNDAISSVSAKYKSKDDAWCSVKLKSEFKSSFSTITAKYMNRFLVVNIDNVCYCDGRIVEPLKELPINGLNYNSALLLRSILNSGVMKRKVNILKKD